MITDEIRAELFICQDLKYRDFHSKLMPDYNKNNIIGVRLLMCDKEVVEV